MGTLTLVRPAGTLRPVNTLPAPNLPWCCPMWRACITSSNPPPLKQYLQVGVSNLSAKGTVRIAIKPLLDELPVAGGIKVGRGSMHWLKSDASARLCCL